MILMLDFDGVLHPEPCIDDALLFTQLPLIEEILRDMPSVEIVITSTWRERRTVEQLRKVFSPDIASRVIGATPSWRDHPTLAASIGPTYLRSIEIEAWLRTCGQPWLSWIALDDKPYLFRPFCKRLLQCDPITGISKEIAAELRSRLTIGE